MGMVMGKRSCLVCLFVSLCLVLFVDDRHSTAIGADARSLRHDRQHHRGRHQHHQEADAAEPRREEGGGGEGGGGGLPDLGILVGLPDDDEEWQSRYQRRLPTSPEEEVELLEAFSTGGGLDSQSAEGSSGVDKYLGQGGPRRAQSNEGEYEASSNANVRDRDYLNGLVEESAAETTQACNVAFAKTHKTASTTLAMILVRYARRHNKKLASFGGNHVSSIPLGEAVMQIKNGGHRVDVMHYHYTETGNFNGRWKQAKSMYEEIMQKGEAINYITVVREPRSHFLSYFSFYVQPETEMSLEEFLSKGSDPNLAHQHRRLINPLCMEFGISSKDEVDRFISAELPDFRLVLLTEEFDEGLVVLGRLMGWNNIDLTYSRMMETKDGSRRWDGKKMESTPDFESFPEWVRDAIDKRTALDRKLYNAAKDLYDQEKSKAAEEIEASLLAFQDLQGVMNNYLQNNSSSEAVKWYSGGVQPYKGGPPFRPF